MQKIHETQISKKRNKKIIINYYFNKITHRLKKSFSTKSPTHIVDYKKIEREKKKQISEIDYKKK